MREYCIQRLTVLLSPLMEEWMRLFQSFSVVPPRTAGETTYHKKFRLVNKLIWCFKDIHLLKVAENYVLFSP
jgi:hypothetical protein